MLDKRRAHYEEMNQRRIKHPQTFRSRLLHTRHYTGQVITMCNLHLQVTRDRNMLSRTFLQPLVSTIFHTLEGWLLSLPQKLIHMRLMV